MGAPEITLIWKTEIYYIMLITNVGNAKYVIWPYINMTGEISAIASTRNIVSENKY